MSLSKFVALLAAFCVLSCGLAQAGSISATYGLLGGIPGLESANFVYAGNNITELADEYLGTRVDSPGPGIDMQVPTNFDAFCVEFGQDILVPNGGPAPVNVHADVVPLLGSVTSPGGAPNGGPVVVFDATKTLLIGRLWGNFQPGLTGHHDAAAFQLALWELAFDTDQTLIGPGLLHASPVDLANPLSVEFLAESWLAQVRDLNQAMNTQPLLLITDTPLRQDLITPIGDPFITPEPSSLALAAMGALGLAGYARRRRRTRAC